MGEVPAQASVERHILVIEDDAMVGIGLVSYLEELGAMVTWSSRLEEALAEIARGDRIDVAIVDLNLHGVMSLPAIDRLLARKVHTILCTGYDASSIADPYRALPRAEKPFTRGKIRSLLAGHL